MKSNVSEFERKENKAKLEESKTRCTCATGLAIITLYFTTCGKPEGQDCVALESFVQDFISTHVDPETSCGHRRRNRANSQAWTPTTNQATLRNI